MPLPSPSSISSSCSWKDGPEPGILHGDRLSPIVPGESTLYIDIRMTLLYSTHPILVEPGTLHGDRLSPVVPGESKSNLKTISGLPSPYLFECYTSINFQVHCITKVHCGRFHPKQWELLPLSWSHDSLPF